MYILNITNTIKKMTINDFSNFFFEKYYKRIGFSKENCYHSMKKKKITKMLKKIKNALVMLKNITVPI